MDAEELIESIIRGLMFLAGILGNNWLAIRSLPGKISSIRTNEVLFINLAISNLITNYLVDLPDTIADFAGRWFLGETFCGVFRFCADLSETSSIFTTFFISTYWHQKLVGSLKRGGAPVKLDSLCLVGCLLAGSWSVALVFSIPHFFFVQIDGGNESHEDCIEVFPDELAKQTYEIIYLTLANALPVAGIVFASCQIVVTLLLNQRRIQSHNSATKEAVKEEDKNTENINHKGSVSCDSGQGTSGDDNCSSPISVYTGVPPSTGPNGGLPDHSPAAEKEANADSEVGAQPNVSRVREPAKASASSSSQVRAAKSVVAVASVFLVCWLTHLLLRITNSIHTSSIVVEVASYIAASYTCIIPYIFLYGVKKLSCSCKR
ncbi:rhodopsin-like [Solea senegalensis]|uniref:Rhodopsin-like n=1 Tax=Solea senegalensis TaxID=28829 RepID=A0AAV6PN70_SOLSE|nr:rhodopsin [Solea senegalensis]XP_043872494.1 rhodopsin-like [Solea senegalensis]KAG7467758.1 rhodopsin-like [Solea senegalensis]KAG7498247.1 rhodopsin-like [Solea senegalensis]